MSLKQGTLATLRKYLHMPDGRGAGRFRTREVDRYAMGGDDSVPFLDICPSIFARRHYAHVWFCLSGCRSCEGCSVVCMLPVMLCGHSLGWTRRPTGHESSSPHANLSLII